MKKRTICYLLSIAIIITFIPCMYVQAATENELIQKLKNSTSDNIVQTYFDDFDGDGKNELFALVGKSQSGSVWYVSDTSVEKLEESYFNASPSESVMSKVIHTTGGKKSLEYFQIYGNGQYVTMVCMVENDNVKTAKISGYLSYGTNGWFLSTSDYDCTIDKEDFYRGEYFGTGRSWKNYWYCFDENINGFKEYGGTAITKEQFCEFNGAEEILSLITTGTIYNILYRENGIININVIEETEIFKNKISYNCSNILVGYDNDSVWVIQDESNYNPNIRAGFYLPAKNPDIATYPEFKSLNQTETNSKNVKKYSAGWYNAKLEEETASYGLHIENISENSIEFSIEFIGKNNSPIYEAEGITAKVINDCATFNWSDSWGNSGNGKLIFEDSYLDLTLIQTYTADGNRSTLACENRRLYPQTHGLIKDEQNIEIDPNEDISVNIDFAINNNKENASVNVIYNNNYFSNSSTEFNMNLAKVSVALSAAAYEAPNGLNKDNNIWRAVEDLNFSNIETKNYDDEYFNNMTDNGGGDKCGYVFAEKWAEINGEATKVVLVVVRGTAYKEWYDNFHVIKPGSNNYNPIMHYSFENAAKEIEQDLSNYLGDYNGADNVKILVTGHSRGAAVANLVARNITENRYADKNNIYAYTYATPNGTTEASEESYTRIIEYPNIWNIINPEDFVPYVAFTNEGWNFEKWGHILYLPEKNMSINYKSLREKAASKFKSMSKHNYDSYPNGYLDTYKFIQDAYSTGSTIEKAYKIQEPSNDISLIQYFNMLAGYLTGSLELGDIVSRVAYDNINLSKNSGFASMGRFLARYGNFDLPDSHDYTTYIAWINSISTDDLFENFFGVTENYNDIYNNGYEFRICCPVDVYVTDSKDTFIGKVVNGESETNLGEKAIITVEGDSKIIYIDKDADVNVNVKIEGYDKGVVNCSLIEKSNGNETGRLNFYDISVEDGTTLTTNIDINNLQTDKNNVIIHNGSEKITADEYIKSSESATVNIKLEESANGTIIGGGRYKKGDIVTLISEPNDNYEFNGWYSNGECISTDSIYDFFASDDMNISAQFKIAQKNFTDISQLSSIQKDALNYCVENGIINGYDDNTFKPFNNITRAEFSTIVSKYMGYNTTNNCNFDDAYNHWASQYIQSCVEHNAIHGIGNNKFAPDANITFEQAVKILTILKDYINNINIDNIGGYPNGYIKIGEELDLFDNMDNTSIGQDLSRIDVAMLIYNTKDISEEQISNIDIEENVSSIVDNINSTGLLFKYPIYEFMVYDRTGKSINFKEDYINDIDARLIKENGETSKLVFNASKEGDWVKSHIYVQRDNPYSGVITATHKDITDECIIRVVEEPIINTDELLCFNTDEIHIKVGDSKAVMLYQASPIYGDLSELMNYFTVENGNGNIAEFAGFEFTKGSNRAYATIYALKKGVTTVKVVSALGYNTELKIIVE